MYHLPCTSLTEDEAMMQEAARQFAQNEIMPNVQAMDDASAMTPELIKAVFDQGFMGIEVPEEFDGSGSSFTSALLVIEELARADPSVSVMADIHNTIINNTFSMWASPELKREWLPRLATDTLGSFALSEASSGSDAFALKTSAKQEAGGDYVLNGEKMWISNSAEAGVFLVMANAAPEKGYKGITCFVVPAGTPGLSLGPREEKLGIKASSTCPVLLEDVRVPSSAVLGEVGKGYKYAIEILNEGRVGIGAQMIGLAQGALDRCLPYLHERRQFNTRVMDFQGVQHQVAQLATELEAARLLVYNAARMKEAGMPIVKEVRRRHRGLLRRLRGRVLKACVAGRRHILLGPTRACAHPYHILPLLILPLIFFLVIPLPHPPPAPPHPFSHPSSFSFCNSSPFSSSFRVPPTGGHG